MPGSHPVRWIILLCGALAAFGCASTDTDRGATGSLSLDLVLAGDIEIDVVDWEITGNGMDMGGSIDVSAPGSTASVEVYGLPVGKEPYVVELSAVSVDKQVTCRGSAEFDVEVGVSTPVMVILNCKLPQELGGVRVNGKFNICAQLTKMVVAPLQTSVGNDISLFSTASDEEGDPIAYMWSSHSGSIADPVAASTTYTCTEVGDDDITVLVTDDDGTYCMSMWTVRVTCVAGDGNPCDDVTCEDDGNECTSEACNPGTGQCETSNVADGTDCDGGAGMCTEGTCVAKNLCMDVVCGDDGNDCTAEICNPDTGECETSNVDNGTSCNDASGMCMNGDCVPNDLCIDVVCEDTGNDCTAAACNPSTGECETSNVDNGTACDGETGTCNEGVCEPNPECVVDADCPDTGNECIDAVCDGGTCGTSNNTDACDGGNGTCNAGVCEPNDLCMDVVCEDDGNECTDEACNPANGGCETSNNTNPCNDDTGTCNAGVCEPNAEVVYEQDFNQLDMTAGDALTMDGWLVFGNVFDSAGGFLFGYGPFGAPNGGQGFSAIVNDQGGPEQEPQQLSVYSDYGCCQPSNGHFNGTDLVEALVFQEPRSASSPITSDDIGKTFTFSFDAKNGDIQPPTTARAYIQTLNPNAGFSQTNFVPIDMTNIGTNWNRYTITLDLTDPLLEGQILQFGFSSTTSDFAQSQNVYDNIVTTLSPTPVP
jgi:hypothetical protein